MDNWFKRNGTHFAIIGGFFILCFIYFTPAFKGKTLGQNDVTRAQSTQKEIMDYRERDTTILWTNQILGGMPTYQIWAPYSNNITSHVISGVKAVFPNPVDTILIFLIGAYFLFQVLKINPWLSAAGAIAFTFSSYNIILLVAGHANQAFAIAFFAPILAGLILTFRGQYLLGASLTAFFLAMEIRANHLQMTYYLMLALLVFVIIELYHAFKNKNTAVFAKAIGYLAASLVLALAVNASILWSTAEYSKETIRGKANLTKLVKKQGNGIDRDYAYEWSQGVGECFTFLIPNLYGGATSRHIDEDSKALKVLTDKGADAGQAAQLLQSLPSYWGEKRFTEGPFYFGAAVCFLFVLGLIIVKNRIKWWLLATVILTMLLSFGRHFPYISDLFFYYFPLYNKFRAVESILAVAQLCFAMMAVLAVNELIVSKDRAPLLKKTLLAFYITAGITLVIALTPESFFSFKPSTNQDIVNYLAQIFRGDTNLANELNNTLVQERVSMARADAFRSLIFIVVAFGILWLFIKQKINVTVASVVFLAVILFDMWQVDKRYLKDESFVDKADVQKPTPREVDEFILRDKDPNFRVFDTTVPILQDAITPYFHKSIGGYSAARLRRYDELVENQLTTSINNDVLDMLNTKYILTQNPKNQSLNMQANSTACGHAWFVKKIQYAQNADQEMQAISSFAPKDEAIVDKRYKSNIDEKTLGIDPTATIKLVKYSPDHLIYESGSRTSQVAVFSEIYYDKGWKMLIDGKEAPYFRADYVLRAAQLPIGNHKIEFIFHPASYYTGEGISLAGSILLVLAVGGSIFLETRKKQQTAKVKA